MHIEVYLVGSAYTQYFLFFWSYVALKLCVVNEMSGRILCQF